VSTKESSRILMMLFAAALLFISLFSAQAAAVKRSKSDRDINAIGRRDIVHSNERKFITSTEKERQLGAQYFVGVEHSAKVITDHAITDYLSELVEKIERNSDAHIPIRVVVLDNNTISACTSPGGYQYITRGLLVHTQNEGQLASVLAHGVAQTALHIPTRQQWRQTLMMLFTSTPSTIPVFSCTSLSPLALTSGMLPTDELDADYFGVQYLYKSGYDPECYLRFVQQTWPLGPGLKNVAFNRFPPTLERLNTLRREIADILPSRKQSIESTSAFEKFQLHLRNLPPLPPEPDQPVLLRPTSEQLH
jgi:predicted Zn-dependent protease